MQPVLTLDTIALNVSYQETKVQSDLGITTVR